MTTDDDNKSNVEEAEAKIKEGEATIARGEHELEEGERELNQALHHEHHPDRYPYTVDGTEYFTESKALTGLQIKSKVPNVNLAYQLVEESGSSGADRVIADNDTVEIAAKRAPAFYLVPPATFG